MHVAPRTLRMPSAWRPVFPRGGKRMRRMVGGLLALVAVAVGIAVFGATVARATQPDPFGELQERLLSGEAYTELHDGAGQTSAPTNYNPRGSGDCAATVSSNVKLNQNCLNVSD